MEETRSRAAIRLTAPADQFEVDTIVYRETGTGILSEYHAEPFTFTIP